MFDDPGLASSLKPLPSPCALAMLARAQLRPTRIDFVLRSIARTEYPFVEVVRPMQCAFKFSCSEQREYGHGSLPLDKRSFSTILRIYVPSSCGRSAGECVN